MALNSRLRTLNVLVENNPGVLNRVSGMIRRRGFNISELAVGPSETPGLSRMSLTVDAGHAEVDQVRKQLGKLIEVIEISDLTDDAIVVRELVMARVTVPDEGREAVLAELAAHGARVAESGPDEVIVELAVTPDRLPGFIEAARKHGLKELARSGPVTMRRTATQ